MASHLDDIVSLQGMLSELEAAQEQLNGIPEWMTELHAEHSERLAEIAELEEAVEDSRRVRREAEAEIADAQEKLKRYQDQINQVTTQREYGALLQEIEVIIHHLQRKGLLVMTKITHLIHHIAFSLCKHFGGNIRTCSAQQRLGQV